VGIFALNLQKSIWPRSLFFLILLWAGIPKAIAVMITPLAGGGMSGGSINESVAGYSTEYRSLFLGGGLTFEFSMSRQMTFEVGGFYMPRGYIENQSTPTEISFTTIQIPVLFRYYLLPGFSVGLGGYFSHGIGTFTSYPAADPGLVTTQNYDELNFGADDYGLELSVGIQLGVFKSLGIVMQTRFLYGLADVNQTPGLDTYLYDFQGFVGIRFGSE